MRLLSLILALLLLTAGAHSQDNWGTSGDCNYNVYHMLVRQNGALDNEIRSVFRFGRFQQVNDEITLGPNGCTGALLNQDDRSNGQLQQIFLTAEHCAEQTQNGSPLMFIFNYQSPTSNDDGVPFADILQGDFLLNGQVARGNDGFNVARQRPGSSATSPERVGINDWYRNFRYIHISTVERVGRWNDLAIMRIVEPIPAWFNVFYSGWNGLAPIVPSLQTVVPGISWDPMYGPAPFYCISQINSFKLCYQELFIG